MTDYTTIKTNVAYNNRLIIGENLMLGTIAGEGSDKVSLIIHHGYNYPFDTYGQATIESIIWYVVILFDALIMIQLIQENSVFKEDFKNKLLHGKIYIKYTIEL